MTRAKPYRFIFIGPEGTWLTIVAINGADRFRLSIVGTPEKVTHTEDDIHAALRRAMGRDFDYQILSVIRWVRRELVADSYGSDRVYVAGDAARKAYGDWYPEIMRHEWFMNGYHLGYRYDDSPIVWPDGTPAPPLETSTYTQTARPGARAPHVWLADGRSTLDLFGRGFVLLRLGGDAPTGEDLQRAAAERGVPLRVVALDAPGIFAAYQRRL